MMAISYAVAPGGRTLIGEVPFVPTTLRRAADWFVDAAADRDPDRDGLAIRLANAYCVALASQRPDYEALLADRGVNFPDGAPVVAAMNLVDAATPAGRVRGPSFFRSVLEGGVDRGLRHFFLGSTPETLAALTAAVRDVYPGVIVSGSYSPPFAELDEAYLDDLVRRAAGWDADVVWVGMGTPKQDFVAQALADRAHVNAVGVGAAFDFAAGTVREAPRWVQASGLEWAWRFAAEPRRLWHRYVFGNSRFLLVVGRQLLVQRASRLTGRRRKRASRA